MKLVIILITVACLQVSASALAQKITLNEKDAPLEKIFNDIKDQTGFNFFYEHNILNGTSKITINVKDANLTDVLNQCLANQPLVYTIAGRNIGVKKKEVQPVQQQIPQPAKDIIGQVTTKQGIPLNGATVLIKRIKTGTLTDAKGDFALRNVFESDTIIVSYIGYRSLSEKVGTKTVFNFLMTEATNDLDQVVIEGYSKTSERFNTGNISTVRAADIEKQPVMNALTALEGAVPGLVIAQNNGYASSPFKAEIRGRSVIDYTQPSEPLYIIDGVPLTVLNLGNGGNYNAGSSGVIQSGFNGPAGGQSPIFSINPQDIESISVLKDADATAIYGSRGANGVIIITTKTGKAGNTKVDADYYQGFSKVTGKYDMLNTQQYIEMRTEALKNDGLPINSSDAFDLVTWNTNRYTDWQKFVWGQNGQTRDAQVSLAGGDKQNTFRIGASYHDETSILSRSGSDKRASLQFNYSHKSLDQKLSLSYTNEFSYTESDLINVPGSISTAPDAPPVFNSQGNLNFIGWEPVPTLLNNFGVLFQPYNSQTYFLNNQLKFQYEILKNLNFSTQLGYNTFHNNNNIIVPIISQNPNNNPTGSSYLSNSNTGNGIVEPQLTYNKVIAKGKLEALVGASYQSAVTNANSLVGTGIPNDNLLQSVNNAAIKTGSNAASQYKYTALYSRINYNWSDEFIFDLTGRRDGSSRFGPGKQFGNFGAIGLAWIFTQESWVKDHLPFLSFGKLRGSDGLTGNDGFSDYIYLTQWSGNNLYPYQGSTPFVPLLHSDPDLHWETNHKIEAALDLGFLKDRVSLELAWYRNTCGNQLITQTLPYLTGFNTVFANSPATILNTGWEGEFKAKIIDQNDWNLDFKFNIGFNINKITAFPNLQNSPYASVITIGKSLSMLRLLHYTGVDPQTGQYTFEDKNHNGTIDYTYNNGNNDLNAIDLGIRFSGGFTFDLRYKKLDLSLFFVYVEQPYLQSSIYNNTPGAVNINQSVAVLNRWQKPGDIAQFAKFTTEPTLSDQLFYQSDGVYSNGSFIRLRNLSLTCDLSGQWIKKIGFEGCKVFVRGNNLFILTRYNGLDPESPNFGYLPVPKVITGGVQFNF